MSEWQPIETAPKGEEDIEIASYHLDSKELKASTCFYDFAASGWYDETGRPLERGGWRAYAWRPETVLPDPPVSS